MRSFFGRYTYFFLLLLVFFIAEIIVSPIGDFPLNDDWSYGKAVYYSMTKSYTIGQFGAMALFTHLMWGMLFVKIFGFSFTVFRISTLVSVIISLFFLDRLIFKITQNKMTGFLACLVLLFNPLYFNLSNTYMTDVNFNTLLILCFYFAFHFFETRKLYSILLFYLFAILLVLLRQFGIVVPLCFMLGCLFLKEKRWMWFSFSVVGTAVVYLSLHTYENYLREILPQESAYKFSGGIRFSDEDFWKLFAYNFGQRYKVQLVQIFIYIAPLAVFYLLPLMRAFKIYVAVFVLILNLWFVYWFFKDVRFPYHNVFENIALGPETFYESLKPRATSDVFGSIMNVVKYVFSCITLTVLSLYLVSLFKPDTKENRFTLRPEVALLFGFIVVYSFTIFITESYFDRYYIPLITAALILITFISKRRSGDLKPALILLLPLFYISVLGTKDYLMWNRLRWEAYAYLKENKKITAENVNGGFEINCWNDLKENWWYDYTKLDNFDYLIQFRKEEGFTLLKEYEFQRYLPYKKDKINIFVKEAKE